MHVYLETARLMLRRLTPLDLDDLFELDNDPAVMRYINGGLPASRQVIAQETLPRMTAWYQHDPDFGYWAAQERVTGEFLGWFALHPVTMPGTPPEADEPPGDPHNNVELGYRLRRSAWGKGYATEGCRALIQRAFTELGVQRVFATTMTVNVGSRGVMEKVGLRYVRTFHADWPEVIEDGEQGDVEYELRREDWRPSP